MLTMIRKWLIFALSAGILVSLGAGVGLTMADDEKETPLAKVMEKVQKNYLTITKGTRNAVYFKKSQKDVEKSAKEIVKLAEEAKTKKVKVTAENSADRPDLKTQMGKEVTLKEWYLKNAKDEKEPSKKWDELIGSLIKNSEKLGEVAGKPDATLKDAKNAFNVVKKNCSDCHTVFRVDESTF
jgi:hypothetical protein